jgi:lysophospholipase L1-like esterase
MFLGDSLTADPGCWRALVWQELSDSGYAVDAVGPQTVDGCGGVTDAEGGVWDPDHAGYSGITATAILPIMVRDHLLDGYRPQVIVMLLGTNDVWSHGSADALIVQYQFLLDYFRKYDPTIALVVGTLPPMSNERCSWCQPVIDEVNPAIVQWATRVSTPESPVHAASLDVGFDVVADTRDGVHPSTSGDARIAAAFLPAIAASLDAVDARADDSASPVAWIALAVAAIATGSVLFAARKRAAASRHPRQAGDDSAPPWIGPPEGSNQDDS